MSTRCEEGQPQSPPSPAEPQLLWASSASTQLFQQFCMLTALLPALAPHPPQPQPSTPVLEPT